MAYGLTNNFKFGTIIRFTAKEFGILLVDELYLSLMPTTYQG